MAQSQVQGAMVKVDPEKQVDEDTSGSSEGFCTFILKALFYFLIAITFPVSLCFCIKIVKEYQRAVIFRLGRALPGARGPGMFFIIPCIDSLVAMDLRTISFDVPPQEILTRDSVTIAVDAVVYYRIFNPMISVIKVENAAGSTRLLAATTLRNFLGTKTLAEVLSEREGISTAMQNYLDEGTDPWGVKVERVEIKDVRLPMQLQRAMATEAEATREAKAKVVAAEGEMQASHALTAAAAVLAESPAAIQLRYLQTLTSIAAERNSTIIFPLPIDLIKGMLRAPDQVAMSSQLMNSKDPLMTRQLIHSLPSKPGPDPPISHTLRGQHGEHEEWDGRMEDVEGTLFTVWMENLSAVSCFGDFFSTEERKEETGIE